MAHVATITIDHTKVAADLTDFPVLIIANGDAGWDELYALATEGGGDIRVFKSDDTTELPREIVSFTVSGEAGEIHIKYSGTLSSTVDTDIHIYADGTSGDYSVSATYGRNNVWTNYVAVWHAQEASGTRTDSKGSNNLTDNNTVASAAGKIGTAADFEQANSEYLSIADASQTGLDLSGDFSIQMIVKPESLPGSGAVWGLLSKDNLINHRSYSIDLYNNAGSQKVRLFTSGTATGTTYVESTWTKTLTAASTFHLTWTYDISNGTSTRGVLYANGSSEGNGSVAIAGSVTSIYNGTAPFILGNYDYATPYYDGLMDEIRITTAVLTSTWLTTEYNNHNSPGTFYSVAAEDPAVPQALTANARASSTIATKKTFKRTLTAPARASATVTLRKTFKRTLTALTTAGSTIARANLRFLTLTANLIGSSTIATESINAVLMATNLAIGATITIKKSLKRTLTAGTTAAATIARRSTRLQVMVAAIRTSATTQSVRTFYQNLTAAIRTSATTQSVRTFYQNLTAAIRTSAAVTRGSLTRSVVLSAILSVKGSLGEYFYKRKYEAEDEDYKRKY